MARTNTLSWTRDHWLSPAHTDSGPEWALTFFDCSWVLIDRQVQRYSKREFLLQRFFFFSFFPFSFRKMTRSKSSSPAPDVSPIYLFIYFLRLPRHRRRRCHRLRLERLSASVVTVCLEVGPSAVRHHRFFLGYMYNTAILSYLESRIETFEAHPKLATLARNRHVAIFRYHGVPHT